MSQGSRRPGEFDLIERYLAPLAKGERGAFLLKDDAAVLSPRPAHEFVLTADCVVEGIHFLRNDPPADVARKALRVNLSDLAAKGARPRAYLMTTAWPAWVDEQWVKEFASGLAADQLAFGIHLIGGDTVSTPGPLSISITAIGEVRRGKMLKRSGARSGDDIWVTGTIGDAGLGLAVSKETVRSTAAAERFFLNRYRIPVPRCELGVRLGAIAHACIDVSDGLVADAGHLSEVSGVGIEISSADVPVSDAARALLGSAEVSIEFLLTCGDDYELAFAAPPSTERRLRSLSRRLGVAITKIGKCRKKGAGVTVLAEDGRLLQFARSGFTHF
ncbi:MAG: thiamine-phosphate kinase [Micropepsaceae bacterium]